MALIQVGSALIVAAEKIASVYPNGDEGASGTVVATEVGGNLQAFASDWAFEQVVRSLSGLPPEEALVPEDEPIPYAINDDAELGRD